MSACPDLTKLTLTEAARQIKDGTTTSLKLTSALLERIKLREPEIAAWAYLNPDFAMAQANAADAALAAGEPRGPLHGVPIGVKDIIDTRELPTQNGCPIFEGNQPNTDATVVTRLKAAGAVIMGKTTTTELALLTPAKTKNPVDTTRTPGGSSAGSAAAVADFMVPAALGTQTAGSVLRPASYTGVYGFKPTLGLIPRKGVLMQSHTLDTVGMLTRSLEDVALLTEVLAQHDPDDATSISLSCQNLTGAATTAPASQPRFALVKTPVWNETDSALQKAFDGLKKRLNDHCVEIEIDIFADIIEWQRVVQIAENAIYYGPLLDEAPEHISKGLTQRIQNGRKEPVTAYIDAIINRPRAYDAVRAVLDQFDAIITPAAPGMAPKGFEITGSPIFNGSWTYLGVPTLSIPILQENGLPIGVQLVGKRCAEAHLLATAAWLSSYVSTD